MGFGSGFLHVFAARVCKGRERGNEVAAAWRRTASARPDTPVLWLLIVAFVLPAPRWQDLHVVEGLAAIAARRLQSFGRKEFGLRRNPPRGVFARAVSAGGKKGSG